MATGMHDSNRSSLGIIHGNGACIGETGLLPDRECIHVRPEHNNRSLSVLHEPDHPKATNAPANRTPGSLQSGSKASGCPFLLSGKLGVGVKLPVQVFK